jgi:peptidyl-tRNA hydrolase, PTH1 family
MKLIVGLGNIGTQYANTRHNIGFMVADQLAAGQEAKWKPAPKFNAETATIELGDTKIILAKPQTMMNLSGEAIQRIMQFYKIAPADVWVLFDDVDVEFGRLRLRAGGGSGGGHQGAGSTIQHIGTGFVRVRIGISLNDRAVEPSEVYVLRPFNPQEQKALPALVTKAARVILDQLTADQREDTTFDLLPQTK